MEERIARFMMVVSKFEFFLVNRDPRLAHLDPTSQAVKGINWAHLGQILERKFPFQTFEFDRFKFRIFKETVPQRLVLSGDGRLKWDGDEIVVSSWEVLLGQSFAQLRNNVAHGNKAQLPAPFTHHRTMEFLEGGFELIEFIATEIFGARDWESPIVFR